MHSLDMVNENIKKIGSLFPECITETVGEDGKTKVAIDFERLQENLSHATIGEGDERYQFTWPGKREAIHNANAPTNMTLRPCKEESVDFDNTENLYIEGDNLEVLKLLQENYLGKIKMIYIDPPYNTGNDFVYNDDFKEDTETFQSKSGMYDEDGNMLLQNFEKNSESNGRFHTDWLNMMYPRLKIARNLLSDDGVIFISIDDNEVDNLRKVGDEVFGESCFVANLVWQKKFARSNDATYFSTMHDHILCYCKNSVQNCSNGWKIGLLPRNEEIPTGYSNPDNDPRGLWTSVSLSAKSGSESLTYEITTPSGRKVVPPSGRYWSCSKETYNNWLSDKRIWFGNNGDGVPRKKTFLSEVQSGLRPNTLILHTEGGHNQEGKQELKNLFDGSGFFDGPKPVKLLHLLIQIANTSQDSIVLDFFSGSATTAHAVMQLNAEDGGKRKYICVQLPEKTAEDSEAYKAGYKTICEIGKERIRRAGDKIKKENGDKTKDLDIGFRVLKLADSNMKDVYYSPAETVDVNLFNADNVKEGRTPLDLLFQVMPECNLPLSSKIEEFEVKVGNASFNCFNVADGFLMACFDEKLSDEVVIEIAKKKPYYFYMRNFGLESDKVLDNFEQIFTHYSPSTKRKVI